MIDLAGMMVSMESQPVQIYTTFNMLTTHAKHVTDTERSILLLSNWAACLSSLTPDEIKLIIIIIIF